MRPITTEQATIQTATVEVKTLTLGRKQMTLSVFRQLPREDIVDCPGEYPRLLGEPWGIVNYFWDGCGYGWRREHLHVVWVKGGKLLRACVGEIHGDKETSVTGRESWIRVTGDPLALSCLGTVSERDGGYPAAPHCILNARDYEAQSEWIRRWNEVVAGLANLDQLFIAV